MGTAIKHPVPDRVKPSLTSGHSDAQDWASECPDVKNYKWRLNRMLYSCTHMATVGFKGLIFHRTEARVVASETSILSSHSHNRIGDERQYPNGSCMCAHSLKIRHVNVPSRPVIAIFIVMSDPDPPPTIGGGGIVCWFRSAYKNHETIDAG